MEINVLEQSAKKLVFELKGADNTFCNALKGELLKDKDVKTATYSIKHPLVGIPKFILETKAKKPTTVLSAAVKRLTEKNKDFLTRFKRISK